MIMIHWHNRFYEIESIDKRYTWVAIGAAVIGAAGSIGRAYISSESAKNAAEEYETPQATFNKSPEYPEAVGAREDWWQTLQDWQKSGTYGAVMPNYEDVYKNAENRINQYYWGGPSGGGLIDKLRASAARRNVSESPAMDVMAQRMGAEQAGQLGDISTGLDITKASAVESARTNWLNSIMSLSQMKPAGVWQNAIPTQQAESLWPAVVGGGTDILTRYLMNKDLEKQNTPASSTNTNYPYTNWFNNTYGGGRSQSSLTQDFSNVGWQNEAGLGSKMPYYSYS
jgi:hypothetical protein